MSAPLEQREYLATIGDVLGTNSVSFDENVFGCEEVFFDNPLLVFEAVNSSMSQLVVVGFGVSWHYPTATLLHQLQALKRSSRPNVRVLLVSQELDLTTCQLDEIPCALVDKGLPAAKTKAYKVVGTPVVHIYFAGRRLPISRRLRAKPEACTENEALFFEFIGDLNDRQLQELLSAAYLAVNSSSVVQLYF